VLGTGTDVGKSFATACIARALRERAVSVLALKPVESGVAPGIAGDAAIVANAAGHTPVLSPWRFSRAVSPHLAARDVGTSIDEGAVARWVADEEARAAASVTLVELAGGAFSPLRVGGTNVDLALALEPAVWLLIAPDALGVLHDVTATLAALPRRPDALLLSRARPADASSGTNAHELSLLGVASVLETLDVGASSAPLTAEWLLRRARH
jgi:dethiobiotin synthetase